MGSRHVKFLCEGCRSGVDNFSEEFRLCEHCAGEFRAIWRLYNKICTVRAKARELSPAQLVLRLWIFAESKMP